MRREDKWFLGGTCAGTNWRDELMPMLDKFSVKYFNPVVKDWTEACIAIEEDEKNNKCNCHLYVITPDIKGTYSIAEIVHSAHLANMYGTSVDKMMFVILDYKDKPWQKHEIKSLNAVMKLVENIGRDHIITLRTNNIEEIFMKMIGK